MLPYQGAGAGSGIEVRHYVLVKVQLLTDFTAQDAYVLASLLTHHLTPRLPPPEYFAKVLDIYNRIRVSSAAAMVQATGRQGALYTLDVPELERYKEGDIIPVEELTSVFRAAAQNWSWTATDPEDDRRAALELLRAGTSHT